MFVPPLVDAGGALVGLLLALYAATTEMALVSLSRARISSLVDSGYASARRLETFVEHPSRYIVSAQVLRTLSAVAATAFAVAAIMALGETEPTSIAIAAASVFVLLTLLISLARGVAVRDPERTLLRLYFPVRLTTAVLGPVAHVLNEIGGLAARLLGARSVPEGPVFSTDELHTQASAAREAGLLEEDEQEMIDHIIELDKTTVREIMVPRIDVIALDADCTIDQALEIISAHGYSRLPVYEESIDRILGVLYAKDLFRHLRNGEGQRPIRDLVRAAYFVPDSKKTDELLRELQRQKVHIAIVVDEYGGTAGIVTIEDLLEEIVGEIQDEYDREEAKIVPLGPGEAIFDATVSIGDVNETLDLELVGEDVDTVGGLLYEQLGKVPSPGDQAILDGAILTVESTVGHRIRKVRVARRTAEDLLTTAGAA